MSIEEVYDEHIDKVYRFFYIKCLDRPLAEDLTSQTFIILCEQMQIPGREIQDHKKFLYGIMRNVWLMYLRKKYSRMEKTLEGIEDFEDYVETALDEYGGLTVKERAEVFINRLPDKQREVVAQRLLEERSVKDIAEYLGKDRNYVKVTYKRGVKRLKQMVEDNALAMAGEEVV